MASQSKCLGCRGNGDHPPKWNASAEPSSSYSSRAASVSAFDAAFPATTRTQLWRHTGQSEASEGWAQGTGRRTRRWASSTPKLRCRWPACSGSSPVWPGIVVSHVRTATLRGRSGFQPSGAAQISVRPFCLPLPPSMLAPLSGSQGTLPGETRQSLLAPPTYPLP